MYYSIINIGKIIKYGGTAYNRTVSASPPYGGSGSVRLGHGYAIPTPHSATVL